MGIYQVSYYLDDYQEEQLERMRQKLLTVNPGETKEDLFSAIMSAGNVFSVAEKLAVYEWQLGLRKDPPQREEVYQETKARLVAEKGEGV